MEYEQKVKKFIETAKAEIHELAIRKNKQQNDWVEEKIDSNLQSLFADGSSVKAAARNIVSNSHYFSAV